MNIPGGPKLKRVTGILVQYAGVAALLWTVGASMYIIMAPAQSQASSYMTLADGTSIREQGYVTEALWQREGWVGVLGFLMWPLSLPIMIAITGARAAWLHRQGLLWAIAGTLLLFCFISGFSIGGAFVPAVWCFGIAALLNTIQLKFSG